MKPINRDRETQRARQMNDLELLNALNDATEQITREDFSQYMKRTLNYENNRTLQSILMSEILSRLNKRFHHKTMGPR